MRSKGEGWTRGLPTGQWEAPPPPPPALPPQVKKWASERVEKLPNGNEKRQPVGPACEACFKFWHSCLLHEFASFDDLSKAVDRDDALAKKIRAAKDVFNGQATSSFATESVAQQVGVHMLVDRQFIILTPGELRSELKTPRLLKSVCRGLHTVSVPSEADPSKNEECYVFADPGAPYRRMRLQMSLGSEATATSMSEEVSVMEGQNRHFLNAAWKSQSSGAGQLLIASLPSLPAFVRERRRADDGESTPRKPLEGMRELGDSSGDEGDECDGEDGSTHQTIEGVAASMMSAGGSASLGRPRPRVPAFQESPAKPASAPVSSARSEAGAPSVAAGSRDDDDDGDEASTIGDLDDGDGEGSHLMGVHTP